MPGALAQPVKTPDLTARCVSTSQDILIPTLGLGSVLGLGLGLGLVLGFGLC